MDSGVQDEDIQLPDQSSIRIYVEVVRQRNTENPSSMFMFKLRVLLDTVKIGDNFDSITCLGILGTGCGVGAHFTRKTR